MCSQLKLGTLLLVVVVLVVITAGTADQDADSCKTGYATFPYCNQCAAGYYGYPNCMQCSCMDSGVTAQYCNAYTGQCQCKDNVAGLRCDHCKTYSQSFPACVEDVKDGTLSAWGAWSDWKDHGECGPSDMKGYTQKRTRKRTCDDSTKNIHGKSCAGDSLERIESRFHEVCKQVTGVYMTGDYKYIEYLAYKRPYLWMGIKQGNNECTTTEPTWDARDGERRAYWSGGQTGCAITFDYTKEIYVCLYAEFESDVYIRNMGAMIGHSYKTWYSVDTDGYTTINKSKCNGWYKAS